MAWKLPHARTRVLATLLESVAALLLMAAGLWGVIELLVVRSEPVGGFFAPLIVLAILAWFRPRQASIVLFVVGGPIVVFFLIGTFLVSDESEGFWLPLVILFIPIAAGVLLHLADQLQGASTPDQ